MIFAKLGPDGIPVGFYTSDVHGENIPAGAVPISEADWHECLQHQGLRRILVDDEGVTVVEYTPPQPTSEEARQMMTPLSARQFRLGLIANGISLAQVQAGIDAITDPVERETASVEWEYATSFVRTHPLIDQISGVLSLTPEQIDTMWEAAVSL